MFTNSLTQNEGYLILLCFAVVMILVTLGVTWGRSKTKREFLLANRGVGVIAGALSIGASWIWAPAMFLSSQKTYEQGLAGLFWYIVPNVGTLILFGTFAARLRELLPHGYTLPQFMRKIHDRKVQVAYLFQFFVLQFCSIGIQVLAASGLLATTTGISYPVAGALIVSVPLTYAILGGLRASVATDYLQMLAMIVICAVTVPRAIASAGGLSVVANGLGGLSGEFRNPLNWWVFYSFGISNTVGLLAGPLGDQMQWQRAYALKQNGRVKLTFILGAIAFGCVPLALCNLGFIAANTSLSSSWNIANPQMVGPIAVANLLPHSMIVLFVVMVLAGLCSTIDSSLCAVASLVATDVFPSKSVDDSSHGEDRRISRIAMVIAAAVGFGIAQIPGVDILWLFIFYGTMRASTMIPTIMSLKWSKLCSKTVLPTILTSLCLGGPLLIAGNFTKDKTLKAHFSVAGSAAVVFTGLIGCGLGSLFLNSRAARRKI